MGEHSLLIIGVALFGFALIAKRLTTTIFTAPMLFLALGLALAGAGGSIDDQGARETLHLLAETTLVLVLFTDAAQVDLAAFRRDHGLPLRMLLIGLPLALVLGAAALSPEQINPKIKDMEYAVRGQLVINAMVRHALSTRAVVPDSRLLRCLRVFVVE